jgi:solute carrier family 24 (sodium/potassium/calcium exchanger), member 6
MGFSACFGGPMLNILLGVGLSGSYILYHTAGPYYLHFSETLMVSAIGLLTLLVVTLVFVPWHGYFLTKQWGMFLIGCYVIIMGLNVFVELRHSI